MQGLTKCVTYTYRNVRSANTLIRCGYKLFDPAQPWSDGAACYWYRDL